jgi:hypothetical protein
MQIWMMIISPLLLLIVMLFVILRHFSVILVGMGQDTELFLHLTLSMFEGLCILSWLLMRFGVRVPLLSNLGTVLVAMEHLNAAMFQALRGNSLHMWAQHEDVRQALSSANE